MEEAGTTFSLLRLSAQPWVWQPSWRELSVFMFKGTALAERTGRVGKARGAERGKLLSPAGEDLGEIPPSLQASISSPLKLNMLNDGKDCFAVGACFFHDPADVGNLISGSSAFSKTSLYIRKFNGPLLAK